MEEMPHIINRSEHPVSRKNIDADALKVLYKLFKAGHTVYLVGGGVRDLILGRQPKDFDIVTSARPSQIKKLFGKNCQLIGRRFRLAHVRSGGRKIMEVSTFRKTPVIEEFEHETDDAEGYIESDNSFGTPEQDALRRDFTVNCIFYDIGTYSLIDYVGGADDLKMGIIRTIGDPDVRFREDPVRMIRAIKFSARLNFKIDDTSWQGILNNASSIVNASVPRIQEEIMRLLESRTSCRCFEMLKESGLLEHLLPEMSDYLFRAENGLCKYDKGGNLYFRLFDKADKKQFGRSSLRIIFMIPFMLEAGLLDNDYDAEKAEVIVKTLASRLGMCASEQHHCLQIFTFLHKLAVPSEEKLSKNFIGQKTTAEAFDFYELMTGAGLINKADLQYWQEKFDKSGIDPKMHLSPSARRRLRRSGRSDNQKKAEHDNESGQS